MPSLLYVAAALAAAVGVAHSVLGERYLLTRLFRRTPLPQLFGSDLFTRRTLRFAWHLTTIAWWGFAVLLISLTGAGPGIAVDRVGAIVAGTFAVSGVIALLATRGRHLSWIVFFAIAAATWFGSR